MWLMVKASSLRESYWARQNLWKAFSSMTDSEHEGLGWSIRRCISSKFSVDVVVNQYLTNAKIRDTAVDIECSSIASLGVRGGFAPPASFPVVVEDMSMNVDCDVWISVQLLVGLRVKTTRTSAATSTPLGELPDLSFTT